MEKAVFTITAALITLIDIDGHFTPAANRIAAKATVDNINIDNSC